MGNTKRAAEDTKATVNREFVLDDIKTLNEKQGEKRFELGEQFAAGGQAVLFDFVDKSRPGVSLCLKVIDVCRPLGGQDSSEAVYLRFCNEVKNLDKLKECTKVVDLYTSFVSCGVSYDKKKKELSYDKDADHCYLYLVMHKLIPLNSYFDSVSERLKDADPQERKARILALLKKLTIDVCHALAECEKKEILHRDINDGNIVVLENGDADPDFVLTDFGISRTDFIGKSITKIGTPEYTADEIRNGEVINNCSSDIYSLGVTVGRLLKIFSVNEDCPGFQTFNEIISKAQQKEVRDRYESANEMLEDLKDKLSYEYAKKLFCVGNNDEAFKVASEVIKSLKDKASPEVIDCKRMIAIIKHNKARDSAGTIIDADLFKEATKEMYALAFNEDIKASYLYYLYSMQGMPEIKRPELEEKHKSLLKFLVYSAENGYALAQFAYGKYLFEGLVPGSGVLVEKNEALGFDYIMKAVGQDLIDAKSYLLLIAEKKDPRFKISDETVAAIKVDIEDKAAQKEKFKRLFL